MTFCTSVGRIRLSIVIIFFVVYYVSTCPLDKTSWKKRSMHFNCAPLSYHCGFTERGTLEEFCFSPRTLRPEYCPTFDSNTTTSLRVWNCTHNVPIVNYDCREESLPGTFFQTDELFKYPVCFLGQEIQLDFSLETPSRDISTPILDSYSKPKNSTILNEGRITVRTTIVAFLIVTITINIIVIWIIKGKQRSKPSSNEIQNAEISYPEIANEEHAQDADTYEFIDELALPPVAGENENMNDDKKDDDVDT